MMQHTTTTSYLVAGVVSVLALIGVASWAVAPNVTAMELAALADPRGNGNLATNTESTIPFDHEAVAIFADSPGDARLLARDLATEDAGSYGHEPDEFVVRVHETHDLGSELRRAENVPTNGRKVITIEGMERATSRHVDDVVGMLTPLGEAERSGVLYLLIYVTRDCCYCCYCCYCRQQSVSCLFGGADKGDDENIVEHWRDYLAACAGTRLVEKIGHRVDASDLGRSFCSCRITSARMKFMASVRHASLHQNNSCLRQS